METRRGTKKTSLQDWHPADIVAALHKRGTTLRKLAERHNVSAPSMVRALRERSGQAERHIAAVIGVNPQVIWPSRYEPDGSRLDLRTVAGRARRVNGNHPAAN